jgi:C1A family cysteine protease
MYPKAISEYRWGFSIDDVVESLGYIGPVVLGVNWYSDMFTPDSSGYIKASGRLIGGHAVLAVGVNIKENRIQLHNSWGKSCGFNGNCYISISDVEMLLKKKGEACIPIKRKFVEV